MGEFVKFWHGIMANVQDAVVIDGLRKQELGDDDIKFWRPITLDELHGASPDLEKSPGPDGITSRQILRIPRVLLCKIMNVFVCLRGVPKFLSDSRTVFIPKKVNSNDPSHFRPLSMSSLLCRLFHKILGQCIEHFNNHDFQMGFRKFDGAAASIFTLDYVLKLCPKNITPVNYAFIDIKKAFDSISHDYLWIALEAKKLPGSLISYIKRYYQGSRMVLCLKGRAVKSFHPTRGVKKGDPMSPVLFNIAMEYILTKLHGNIGVALEETKINHIAYADDLVLLAGTASGLQRLVDEFGESALRANLDKTRVASILAHGKIGKVSVGKPTIKYRNNMLIGMEFGDCVRYLGIDFNPFGIIRSDLVGDLDNMLCKLSKSFLKPQQRLWVLKNCVFGRLAHKIPFTDLSAGLLN